MTDLDRTESETTSDSTHYEDEVYQLLVDDGRVYASGEDPEELIHNTIDTIRRYRLEFGPDSGNPAPDFLAELPTRIVGVVKVARSSFRAWSETRHPLRRYEGEQP